MSEFVICIDNRGNPASLIIGKAYRTVDDAHARDHGLLRVVDDDSFGVVWRWWPLTQDLSYTLCGCGA